MQNPSVMMFNKRLAWATLVAVIAVTAILLSSRFLSPKGITRIAFGSCNSTAFAQPIWSAVLQAKPDVWIWTGDSIYADTLNIHRFHRLYAKQRAKPLYRKLMDSAFITGTWDDHDYGANDAGKEYPLKDESQKAFLDFLGAPEDDPRRQRQGVYGSHDFGPKGQRLKIILLDTRYHREAPAVDADMLGEKQWKWLAAELQQPDIDLNILVTSIAAIAREPEYLEGWARFPESNRRLSRLLVESAAPVVLLSGDRHFAEISRYEHPSLPWPLYEVMSSGLTHAASSMRYNNPYRVGQLYNALNFGFLEIDWGEDTISVKMQVRDTDNKARIADRVVFNRALD